jgi:hypothetical protein
MFPQPNPFLLKDEAHAGQAAVACPVLATPGARIDSGEIPDAFL